MMPKNKEKALFMSQNAVAEETVEDVNSMILTESPSSENLSLYCVSSKCAKYLVQD